MRRYGFHGLSYEYIASVLPAAAPEIAGGRSSWRISATAARLCAMQRPAFRWRRRWALPPSTACRWDPLRRARPGRGALPHAQKGMSAEAVDDLLYRRSGMLGLSGISSDFRELLASNEPRHHSHSTCSIDPRAEYASLDRQMLPIVRTQVVIRGEHHRIEAAECGSAKIASPTPYYQNTPMLSRLLAEWSEAPAGCLFLLPLWHPVLVAEQIGTLAAVARRLV